MKPGKVYLGGAGPGDPGLVTLRLLEVLRDADVILYDRLLDRSILREAKSSAEIIDVGKGAHGGDRGAEQRDINSLLLEHASRGKTVLRLKGGDPFVFGRGAEECEALAEAGVPFEVIPGVISASAVPAYAGIPLTHREYSSSFAVATGHLKKGFDFSHLMVPQADTLVYLMGVGNLPKLAKKIIEAGWPEEAPAALIQEGTRGTQRTVVGTLGAIAERAREAGIEAPAVLVVGEVVRLREKLSWFEKKPLFGRRVVVTRATEKQGVLSNALRALGAGVLECPSIAIRPLAEARLQFSSLESLDSFTDIVFTSENGVRLFFEHLMEAGGDARSLTGKRIAAIGPSTAESLKTHGITADLVPATYTAEGILERLEEDLSGRQFLLPRAKGARPILQEEIARRGGAVEEWLLYEAVSPEIDTRELHEADALLFTSSSTVRNLCRAGMIDRGIPAVCIGPVTARTAGEEGFSLIHVSAEATIGSLLEKTVEVLKSE